MSIFIKKLLLFSILLVITYCGLFLLVVFSKDFKATCTLQPDTDFLILGDSHIMWGIDDAHINNTQNIALNAECYLYSYAKLRYLINNGLNVKRIYLGVSYHNLSNYFDDYIFGERSLKYFYRYVDVLKFHEYYDILKNNPKTMLQMSGVVIKTGGTGLIKDGCDFIGSFPMEKMTQVTSQEMIKKRILHHYYNDTKLKRYSNINLKYLERIVNLCNSNSIDLIALNMPMQKDYKKQIPQQYKEKYLELLKVYGIENIDFDGFEMPDSCFLPDGDHLNYYGAQLASQKLNEIIQEQNIGINQK